MSLETIGVFGGFLVTASTAAWGVAWQLRTNRRNEERQAASDAAAAERQRLQDLTAAEERGAKQAAEKLASAQSMREMQEQIAELRSQALNPRGPNDVT